VGLLDGKVAIVTGGGSGIGRAAALLMAGEGAAVVVAGRREDAIRETERLGREKGGEIVALRTDVTKEDEVAALVGEVVSRFGGLDVAFNNAGVEGPVGPLQDLTEKDYDEVFDVNVKALFFAMKYQIPALHERGGGSIVNNASAFSSVAMPNFAFYISSKHAMLGMTRAAALECATSKIRINAITPGGCETEMFGRLTSGGSAMRDLITSLHPIGRLAEPEEIADVVVWLASDRSTFVTGQPIYVDGGYTVQ
jgi:NAD(P)-dependent dehydrogenase (short-subunit alcohol dehydrogenase family)